MTVLQSVCSHGHKLHGDVQQAFNTGDSIKREQPLFVRMPPDRVPSESRDVWVQLLKTVNGLDDGTGEWSNCVLATARGLGFETSVLEPCVLVLRSPQQRYIVSLEWPTTKSGNKQSPNFGKWERRNVAVERSCKQQMDSCALDRLLTSRVWTLCPSGN